MKPKERDDLLVKMAEDIGALKEGVHNTYYLAEKLERHNALQNGQIIKIMEASNKNTVWRRVIVGIGGTVIITIVGWITKIQGLW